MSLERAKQLLGEAVLLPLALPEMFTGALEPWHGECAGARVAAPADDRAPPRHKRHADARTRLTLSLFTHTL